MKPISYQSMRHKEQQNLEEYKMYQKQEPYKKYEEKQKGTPPDFVGAGVAIWMNRSKEGKPYATVQLHGKAGTKIPCFPYQPREK